MLPKLERAHLVCWITELSPDWCTSNACAPPRKNYRMKHISDIAWTSFAKIESLKSARLRVIPMRRPQSPFLVSIILLSMLLIPIAYAKRQPQSPGPYIQAANSFMQSNRYKDAIDNYSKAIKFDKNNPVLYQSRANANISMAKPKKAIGDLNKALSLDPNDPNSYNLRARAYDALADFDKEKDDLDALIKRTPENGVNFLWRARINNQLKNTKAVIADCDHAINLGLGRQELADLYKLRADSYKKLGKKTEARQELVKFNSLQQ